MLTEVTWCYLAWGWAGQEGSLDTGSAPPFPFLRPLCRLPTGGSGLQETKADQGRDAPLPKGGKRQSVISAGRGWNRDATFERRIHVKGICGHQSVTALLWVQPLCLSDYTWKLERPKAVMHAEAFCPLQKAIWIANTRDYRGTNSMPYSRQILIRCFTLWKQTHLQTLPEKNTPRRWCYMTTEGHGIVVEWGLWVRLTQVKSKLSPSNYLCDLCWLISPFWALIFSL